MERSGATLREVGTTNRTHPVDYERAITDRTGLILKVHTSNYKVVGFTADVELPALVAIGKARGIPVAEDLGSGALVDLGRYGLPKEPVVSERLALGVDLVTFSGDKLLGGPQAGIIAGREDLVRAIDGNPLHRAVRCGKLTIAALEATLRLYRQSASLARELPTLRVFTRPIEEIEQTAARAVTYLASALGPGFRVSTCPSTSQVGSGALPTDEIPTVAVAVEHDSLAPQVIAERFRRARPPIIGRITDGRFLLDARAIEHPLDLVPRWATDPAPAATSRS
jgi:L-seryl-tRNA(Ser) seleniumtransferase